jgi:acetoacetyl-CoA synthetase
MNEIPRWFVGARLNFAENLLQFKDDKLALIETGENQKISKWTYAELYEKVRLLAAAFREFGVKPGDRIAGYVPNSATTVLLIYCIAFSKFTFFWMSDCVHARCK